jgi:hypothetical protein
MRIVNERHAVEARMVPPRDDGYLLLAAEVDWRGPLLPPRPATRALLAALKRELDRLAEHDEVAEANVFRAVLVAPGEGDELTRNRGIRQARYDVVVLIRTRDIHAAKELRDHPDYRRLSAPVRAAATHDHEIVARNIVRLGDVDHRPNHAFLFNYFYADDNETLLPVFTYTAGWFQRRTGLSNSVLLQPIEGEPATNGIINHASWPNFRAFLPSLILRPTFRSFVLANFKANDIAAQPIIYRRL